jgi:hypothetical protein
MTKTICESFSSLETSSAAPDRVFDGQGRRGAAAMRNNPSTSMHIRVFRAYFRTQTPN